MSRTDSPERFAAWSASRSSARPLPTRAAAARTFLKSFWAIGRVTLHDRRYRCANVQETGRLVPGGFQCEPELVEEVAWVVGAAHACEREPDQRQDQHQRVH